MRYCFLSIPVQGKRRPDAHYNYIKDLLCSMRHKVLNECVLSPPEIDHLHLYNPYEIHDGLIKKLMKCDVYIGEISEPSLGVGYEIAMAIQLRKPMLLLCDASSYKSLSLMIRGISCSNLEIATYSELGDIAQIILEFLNKIYRDGQGNSNSGIS